MKIQQLIFSFLLSVLLISVELQAQTIGFTLWHGWAEEDGSGFGYEIYAAVNKEIGLKPEEMFFPYNRALVEYANKSYDCYFGLNRETMKKLLNINVVESNPIVRSYLVFYTLKGKKTYASFEQLRGKAIGIVRGTDIDTGEFEGLKEVTISEVSTSIQNIKKLKLNRIDTYLGYYPDAGALKELHFDMDFRFNPSEVTLSCHPNPRNQAYIERFNQGLSAIHSNGLYDKIYQKNFGRQVRYSPK